MRCSFAVIVCTAFLCAESMRTSITKHFQKPAEGMRDDDPPMRMAPSTTVSGCTCKADSKCSSTINSTFSCDWCRTEGDCGTKSWGRLVTRQDSWDFCEYPPMVRYEAQSASLKMTQLWNKVIAEAGTSGPTKSVLGVVGTMIGESMRTPFDNHWDVMPEGRTKVIHSQGVHCQFDLNIAESPFTGLFAAGTRQGIIRIGSASSNDRTGKPPFPGLSFKFLRSGVQSGNFVALRATGSAPEGGGGYKFFDSEFSKIVNPPAALKALMKFEQASDCVAMVGLSDVCSYAQDGTLVPSDSVEFPYDVLFEASSDQVHLPDTEMSDEEMLGHLSAIESGTHLLNVYAMTSPTSEKIPLGKLTTTSECVKSAFGDQSLFFRHQRMEEDFVKKPMWVNDITAPGCNAVAEASSKWQCPGVH